MKNKFNRLTISITILFMVAILSTFIPELFPEFFGDFLCEGSFRDDKFILIGCHYADFGSHSPTFHWGWRHWLWFMMGLTLFIIQCIRIGQNFNKEEQ